MANAWQHATIRELLTQAEILGRATARTESEREAELLRFAIYNFRKSTGIGLGLTVTVSGNDVIVCGKEVPRITIVDGGGGSDI